MAEIYQLSNTSVGGDILDTTGVEGEMVHIKGTGKITSLGSGDYGTKRYLVFEDSATLVAGASLELPGGVDLVVPANYVCLFVCDNSSQWRLVSEPVFLTRFISASMVQAGSISASAIQASAIQASHLTAGIITASMIGAGSITASQIAASAIAASHISAGSITASAIAAGAIATTHLSAGSVTASIVAAGAISATHVTAGTITGSHITAGGIVASNIAAGAIVASLVAAGAGYPRVSDTLWYLKRPAVPQARQGILSEDRA